MKVCIIGWYGTETLGDRAILDGIFWILDDVFSNYQIYLGSLYPFFTERTLYEDKELVKKHNIKDNIILFDERSKKQLYNAIEESDIVMMGGGPLMDIRELFLIKRAFIYAKKKTKKTVLFGCGVGPLNDSLYISCFKEIVKNTDVCIFRDVFSQEECTRLTGRKEDSYVLQDPAILSVYNYKKNNCAEKINNSLVINMREITAEYGENTAFVEKYLKNIIIQARNRYEIITLMPMHSFFIGGDDRIFLSKLCNESDMKNIKIISNPLGLIHLYKEYMNAEACIGMRYHSVVMQIILNGNNAVLDYTDARKGKIIGFLENLNTDFYKKRYINLQKMTKIDTDVFYEELMTNNAYNYQLNDEKVMSEYKKLILRLV